MTEPRTPPRRWLLRALLVPFFFLAAARLVAPDAALPLIWVSSATVWVFLPAWLLAALAARRRDPIAGALGLFVCLCHAGWVVPTMTAEAAVSASGTPVRVVTANVLYVNRTPQRLLEELLDADADVLVLEEVSPRWVALLEGPEALDAWPHRVLIPRDDAFGIAVLAPHEIQHSEVVDLGGVPMIDATLSVRGASFRVFGVHTLPPLDRDYARVWREQLRELRALVGAVDGPLIVAGDFNGTLHNGGLRALRESGLIDVHDALGEGLATTWPNGLFSAPPLALDHVMVSPHWVPLDAEVGRGEGSDHRPIITRLARRG